MRSVHDPNVNYFT